MAASRYELKEREAFSGESARLEPSAPYSPDIDTAQAPPPVGVTIEVPPPVSVTFEAPPPVGVTIEAPPPIANETDSSLPSYADVTHHPSEPPPSYDSLFKKVKEIKEEANGTVDFISKICDHFISFFYFGLVGLLLLLPVGMLVFGIMYLYDCPAEDYIQIYLVVAGVVGIIRAIISIARKCYKCVQRNVPDSEKKKLRGKTLVLFIDLFIFCWFIAGNVWIYQIHGDYNSEDETADNYCHPVLYNFAFWATTSVYIVICAILFCIVCGICLMCCCDLMTETSSD